MDALLISDQIKSGLTQGWLKIITGYQCSVVRPIRLGFKAINHITGPYGAYAALGGAALGLFYLGHRIRHMKMGPRIEKQHGKAVVVKKGPKSHLLQLMLRMAGIFEMFLSAAMAGGLAATAGVSIPVALGITGGVTLLGILV